MESEDRPELSDPNANTGPSVGRIWNREALSLLMTPILFSTGSIEYRFEESPSGRCDIIDRLVARTDSPLNW